MPRRTGPSAARKRNCLTKEIVSHDQWQRALRLSCNGTYGTTQNRNREVGILNRVKTVLINENNYLQTYIFGFVSVNLTTFIFFLYSNLSDTQLQLPLTCDSEVNALSRDSVSCTLLSLLFCSGVPGFNMSIGDQQLACMLTSWSAFAPRIAGLRVHGAPGASVNRLRLIGLLI